MIIDAHNHPDWHGHDLGRFLDDMREACIDMTWLLSWECPRDEYDPWYDSAIPETGAAGPIPFARCISYAERAPGRFVLGYCPDPRRPGAVDRLKAMREIYGVRVCGELKLRMMYDDPDALRLFRYCGEAGLPVTVHIDYEFETRPGSLRPSWWYGGGLPAFERAVAACPDTVFVGHAPGFWAHISGGDGYLKEPYPKGPLLPGGELVRMMRAHPNLHADTSGESGWNALNRDHAFAREFLIEFQDRILYGRDMFDTTHRELLDSLSLPEPVRVKIFSGNALRLVPLAPERS
jgi:predicted TIM-barrel fold metal-dependent hydrolase